MTNLSMSKICTKCKESKTLENFYKRKSSSDGLYQHCKKCHAVLKSDWYKNNSTKVKTDSARWYLENKSRRSETSKNWVSANLDRYKAYQSDWFRAKDEEYKSKKRSEYSLWAKNNPEKVRKLCAAYRARKLKATPSWFGELDELVMTEAYDLSRLREIATGFDWHVDHMIPLKSKTACGLHVWNNVQVIPQEVNESKNNRMIFTSPLDWLKFIN